MGSGENKPLALSSFQECARLLQVSELIPVMCRSFARAPSPMWQTVHLVHAWNDSYRCGERVCFRLQAFVLQHILLFRRANKTFLSGSPAELYNTSWRRAYRVTSLIQLATMSSRAVRSLFAFQGFMRQVNQRSPRSPRKHAGGGRQRLHRRNRLRADPQASDSLKSALSGGQTGIDEPARQRQG